MDVSGSMTDDQKEIVRIEAFWIDTWLKSQYDGVTTRYIIHDAVAREVDQHTFYHTRESGGTRISSAYNLANKIIDADHPPVDWNIYVLHFSDGDNWGEDNRQCISLLRDQLLPKCNLFGYGQVESPYGSGEFYRELEEAFDDVPNLALSEIRNKEGIYDSIKEFLGTGTVIPQVEDATTMKPRRRRPIANRREAEVEPDHEATSMTTATTIPIEPRMPKATSASCSGHRLEGVFTILRLRGERRVPRMIYLDGSLLLVSPSYTHECLKERLGLFVMEVVVGLDIPCISPGSTTFRRRTKRGGVEGDETYYLANAGSNPRQEGDRPATDPPPDLAIEAVDTHDADEAVEVYRRFGVPEVWVCDQDQLTILVLQQDGRYAASESEPGLPVLTAAEIHRLGHSSPGRRPTRTGSRSSAAGSARVLVPRHRAATE